MTNLPYIVASYVLFAALVVVLAIATSVRLGRAKARLRVLDRRAERPADAAP